MTLFTKLGHEQPKKCLVIFFVLFLFSDKNILYYSKKTKKVVHKGWKWPIQNKVKKKMI